MEPVLRQEDNWHTPRYEVRVPCRAVPCRSVATLCDTEVSVIIMSVEWVTSLARPAFV
jgi:hypothetical protein